MRIISVKLLLVVSCCMICFGCSENFQPIKQNDNYSFSIYGYIDASADTQWVRVTPARQQISVTAKNLDMRVTLNELETGKSAVMNDTLLHLPNGIQFVNVWTTMDVKPQHTYRLDAERPSGKSSSVTVTIPEGIPDPYLNYLGPGCSGAQLYIKDIPRLADVQSVWRYELKSLGPNPVIYNRFSYRNQVIPDTSGDYSIYLPGFERTILPAGGIAKVTRKIFVASGGPEWAEEITSIDDMVYALPDGFSNVENGIGYMIGIVSKTVPFERKYVFGNQHNLLECIDTTGDQNE